VGIEVLDRINFKKKKFGQKSPIPPIPQYQVLEINNLGVIEEY
jgi:hypothetical protein